MNRRIRFTIHDVTITFKLTDKIPSFPNSSPRTHSWSFYSVLHRPFPQLVSFRTSGGPIPSIPKLFSLFLFFLHSYRTQRFPRALWVAARLMQAPPPQGFPARVGVALPCSRRRRVSSSKITNKNKCIFSHGPTILIFPLQWCWNCTLHSSLQKFHIDDTLFADSFWN